MAAGYSFAIPEIRACLDKTSACLLNQRIKEEPKRLKTLSACLSEESLCMPSLHSCNQNDMVYKLVDLRSILHRRMCNLEHSPPGPTLEEVSVKIAGDLFIL